MDSIMRVSVKTNWRSLAMAVLALTVFGDGNAAEFKVADVQAKFAGQSLVLDGHLDLGLSPKVEEAVAKGIPLEIVIDVHLYQKRRYLWDSKIATWALNRRIQYHALSGQYLVSAGSADTETRESLLTQQEALKQLGSLSDLKLALEEAVTGDGYSVDLRVSLDIEALPAPLRPVAYTSFDWHLNSGWSSWKVAR